MSRDELFVLTSRLATRRVNCDKKCIWVKGNGNGNGEEEPLPGFETWLKLLCSLPLVRQCLKYSLITHPECLLTQMAKKDVARDGHRQQGFFPIGNTTKYWLYVQVGVCLRKTRSNLFSVFGVVHNQFSPFCVVIFI